MNNSPNIEVGIIEADRITFNLSGKFELFGTGKTCYNKCTAYVSNDNIVIENEEKEYQPGKKLTFVPCDLNTDYFELKDVLIGIGFHWEKKDNQKFQGALKLKVKGNKLLVINVIPVENYLLSVISSEMNSTSSLELLKAHAIISRSWLMAQLRDGKNREIMKPERKTGFYPQNPPEEFISWYDREDHSDFHVCADDHCQRYQGIERMKNPNVIKAVNETRGQVLTYMDEICDARYSKCCGAITERFENCWENKPKSYLVPVFDGPDKAQVKINPGNEKSAGEFITSSPSTYCNTSDPKILGQVLNDYDLSTRDFFRWQVKYSQDEISSIIFKRSEVDFGRIKDLVPVKRSESGRLVKLKIIGENRSMIIGKELVIRKWLSKSHLYSSAFIVEKEGSEEGFPESFTLKGAGWGHGVGLCQIGAAVMGEKGFSYREILGHYYNGIVINKLYQ